MTFEDPIDQTFMRRKMDGGNHKLESYESSFNRIYHNHAGRHNTGGGGG